MRDSAPPARRIPAWELAAGIAWVALVGVLTLTPVGGWSPRMSSGCLLCGELGGADLIRNILMFMPAGLFLARRRVSVTVAVGLGLLLSAGLESAQLVVPGRHAAMRDVLVNAMGVGTGVVFYRALAAGLLNANRAVFAAAALLPIVAVALTGWLLQPLQTDDVYYAQWVPRRPYYARWDGALLDAAVGGTRTPIGRLRNTDEIRASLRAGGPVALTFRAGTPTNSLTAIYVVMDGVQREILMVGADGHDLVVRSRIRAVAWRLDQPDQRFPDFLARHLPSDTIRLAARFDALGRACVSLSGEERCAPRAALGSAWGIVLWKGELAPGLRRAMDALALALLLIPLSLLTATRRGWPAALAWSGTVVALVLVGRAVGLAWPGVPELVALLGTVALAAAPPTLVRRIVT